MALMLIVLFGLLLVGAPIGVALGGSALLYMIIYTYMDPSLAPAAFFEFLNGYGLMAAPFFIFAGMLMEKTQLLGQIFSFADSLLGWLKGGMGAAGLVTAVILAALTGSSVAAASALALIVVPRMVAVGHPKEYAAGLVCAGGSLAQLIPPSVWMIVYAIMTENSIGGLYAPFRANSGDKYGFGIGIRTERGVFDESESLGILGWDGAYLTRFWVDPKEDLVGVFMSQVLGGDWTIPGRFRVLVYQAIDD